MAANLTLDSKAFEDSLNDVERVKLPRLQRIVVEKLAYETRDAERKKMEAVFDRPTPYALNSMYVRKENALDVIAATIGIRGERVTQSIPPAWFLYPQVEGGSRRLKRHEKLLRAKGILPPGWFCVPGKGAALDLYGNQKGGEIVRVLAFLQAFPTAQTKRRQNMGEKKIGALTAQSMEFFVVRPGDFSKRTGGVVQPGVWKRNGKNRAPSLIIAFTKPPRYDKRLPFYEVAEQTVKTKFVEKARQAYEKVFVRK